ncbi:MAG: katG [Frankiales bacterium]|nr:katG [Frankiales bacterium]
MTETDPKPRDTSASPQGTDTTASTSESENPAISGPTPQVTNRPRTNRDWWPNQVDLSVLNRPAKSSDPLGEEFDYRTAVQSLDVDAVKRDLADLMKTSQEWWPADWGHYGGLFIRMSWHAAGTYRSADGRGGAGNGEQRFAPLNSWPDNANLDKARRLLLPVKQKYGRALSWADLLVLAGNVAHDDMGLKTFGFAFGREDVWQPRETFWGPEDTWLGDERYSGPDAPLDLSEGDLGAVTMGLIYVNPEGPQGRPDPLASAHDIKVTFSRMGMNSEETVALVAGGHTFGKAHGGGDPSLVGPEPEGCPVHAGGLGWKNEFGKGKAEDTITSGIEGPWTVNPTQWDNGYFDLLLKYEWELTESPAGAKQWKAKDVAPEDLADDAHVSGKKVPTMMTTADMALAVDPEFRAISERFHTDPEYFADQYARAWFKLLHRDMGPTSRWLGPDVPAEELVWTDPVPAGTSTASDADVASLKQAVLASGLTVSQLVHTAWSSAASFRSTDKRGGANGARIRLEPQASWAVNAGTQDVVAKLDELRAGTPFSLADTIVLAGCAAVEKAAADAGVQVTVPFTPGRGDATQEQTDVENFTWLEPRADGFRNWVKPDAKLSPEQLLVDRAYNLDLTAKEMTVLVGGLRVLGANTGGAPHGVFTDSVGVLSQDFFRTLLDLDVQWSTSRDTDGVYEARDSSGNVLRTATAADLVFGSNAILRGIAEVYSFDESKEKFVKDFVDAWDKVMMLDRFDVT